MKFEELNRDDYLGKLIQEIELDSPSDNFVENVMAKCYAEEIVVQPVFKTKFKLALPWIVASIVFIGLFALTFLFGGSFIGGSIYTLFSSTGLSSILLKGLATMRLAYVGLTFGTLGGILLIINQIKQQRLIVV